MELELYCTHGECAIDADALLLHLSVMARYRSVFIMQAGETR